MLTAHSLVATHTEACVCVGTCCCAPLDAVHRLPSRRAWVTLLSDATYISGVCALFNSLLETETDYALIVMVTPSVPLAVRTKLATIGCKMREVLPLMPRMSSTPHYACAHFADCWAKLRMWDWEEFDRLCYLDADMLVLKNMDELLCADEIMASQESLRLGEESMACGDSNSAGVIAACRSIHAVQECFCPVAERKALCAYRPCALGAPAACPYFNAGLLVLRPSSAVLAHMLHALETCDLGAFPFAEQDFLNAYFRGLWHPLSWTYNASKALYASHRGRGQIWDLGMVKNVHYTMAKPWDLRHSCHKGFEALNELWHAAFAEPHTLPRVTLRAVMQERKAKSKEACSLPTRNAQLPRNALVPTG